MQASKTYGDTYARTRVNHSYKWQAFVCKTLSQSSNFDASKKITLKYVGNLGGIKDAHAISDCTKLH